MNQTLKSLAILKANYDDKQDYLEVFLVFLANLICEKKYAEIDISIISTDFQSEYGLVIPYHPMQTLLKRASKRDLLKRQDGKFVPDFKLLSKLHFSSRAELTVKNIQELCDYFISFSNERFQYSFAPEGAQKAIMAFLHNHDHEILFAHKYKSILANVEPITRKEQYIANQFIKDIFEKQYHLYERLIDLAVGHIIASAILYKEPTRYIGSLKNVDIFLDTRIILRLSGVEGDYRQKEYESFVAALKEKGAALKIFLHTYEEVTGIFDDCINWIENASYNPRYASPTLKFFLENKYAKSDIVLFKSKVDSLLFNLDIIKVEVDYQKKREFLIKEEDLYNKIVEVYQRNNYQFKEWKMKTAILADVKSISAIFRFRQGSKPNAISSCNSLFVTTNRGLAMANFEFNNESDEYDYKIMECVTDTFLGTQVWLQSPIQMKTIHEFKIIADCLAAIQPDERLIQCYITELNKLKNDGKITEDEYYFLKSHSLSQQLLEEKTFGDANEYRDSLPEEILAEIKGQIKRESDQDLIGEKVAHQKTVDNLLTLVNEKNQVESQFGNVTNRLQVVSHTISNVVVGFLFTLLIPFLVILMFIQSISPTIQNTLIKYGIGSILTLVTMLNLYYGLTMKWLYGKLRDALEHFIEQKVFKLKKS